MPYRDSKLTRILEPSLSGNSKIAIIATVTPASPNFEETSNTLKFAQRAKKVTQKPIVNEPDNDKALLNKYKAEIEDLRKKLEVAQDSETKLKDLQTQSQTESAQVEELKKELGEQEELRSSLEEKIKQLTRLILVSASVDPQPRSRSFTAQNIVDTAKRSRSASMKPNQMLLKNSPMNLIKSVDLGGGGAPPSTPLPSIPHDPDEQESYEIIKIRQLVKVNEALNIKIEALQQQAEWREKQSNKLKAELKDKEDKLKEFLNNKMHEAPMEQLKLLLINQYAHQIESLQEELKEKQFEVEIHKSDNRLLCEKLESLTEKSET